MCKIITELSLYDKATYRETIDVELGTISSIDKPSGCFICASNKRLDIRYIFPESTENVVKYPKDDNSKISFEYGDVSGKIHRFTVSEDEMIHQTDTYRIIQELFTKSNSERFQGNISGFLRLSCHLVSKTLDTVRDILSSQSSQSSISNE